MHTNLRTFWDCIFQAVDYFGVQYVNVRLTLGVISKWRGFLDIVFAGDRECDR